jgi:hypothetical protein
MRGESKSVIDYVLASNKIEKSITQVTIDDKGRRWSIGADHSWIQIEMQKKIIIEQCKTTEGEKPWNMNKNTDWGAYERDVGEKAQKWLNDFRENDEEEIMETAYKKLIQLLTESGEKRIGRINRKKKSMSKKSCRADKRCQKAERHWRETCTKQKDTCKMAWQNYQKEINRTKNIKTKDKMIAAAKWREKVIREGGTSSNSLWRQINKKPDKAINTLQKDGRKITDKEEIRQEIWQYLIFLADMTTEEQTVQTTKMGKYMGKKTN